jgi:hypothetical protein
MKKPYRPSAVLVVAILQITFGALALLCTLCGAFQVVGGNKLLMPAGNPQAAQQQQFQDDMERTLEEKVPHYQLVQYSNLVLGPLAGAVMIVSGIGLLKMRRWGRWLTIGYACYNIVSGILSFIFTITYTIPAMREFVEAESRKPNLPPGQGPALSMTGMMASGIAYGTLALMIYPIGLLIVMFMPDVRAAFRGQAPALKDESGEEEEDLGDEDDAPGEEPEEG